MNACVTLIGLSLAITPLVGTAQSQPQSQSQSKLKCSDVTYNEEFLKHYPRVGAACREVTVKNGEKWVRFDAKIAKVDKDQFTADFLDDFGHQVEEVVFKANQDAQLSVNGNKVKYSSLSPGDTLTVWVPESRLGFYGNSAPSATDKLVVVSSTTPAYK